NQAASEAKIVLGAVGTEIRAAEIGHQVIDLSEAPGKVLGEDNVHAATCSQGKDRLPGGAGHLRASVRWTEQDLSERNEMIESAHIEPRAEQKSIPTATHFVAVHIAVKYISTDVHNQP